ncbi:ATP-binding cassette subfamily C member 4 [Pseudolycoriella hygida]|uniref:ATP-binding cassette subfamily C member 4 n=1 Tax=Pseudolycoriella hygida TaxID=35572 RepID=A0A9Q0S2J9_9DIPT|nr:ATP-binding cassette subfamily C member 4 [Pseudolycoriella hygida]
MKPSDCSIQMETRNGKSQLKPSLLSRCWAFEYLRNGRKKALELDDILAVPSENDAETLSRRIGHNWLVQLKKAPPKLNSALIATFFSSFAFATFLAIMKDCVFRVMQGPALGILIKAFTKSNSDGLELGIYAGIMLMVSLLLFTLFHHYSIFLCFELGMRIRVALSMLIYDKALRLSQFSLEKTNLSQIINLLTNDTNRFDRGMPFIPYIIVAPLQIMSVTGVLWIYLGPSCFALPLLLLLLVPFQSWVGKVFGNLRVAAAKKTDERIKLINEAINGIQMIKMCTYENVYFQKVLEARKAELKMITKTWMFDAINKSVFDVSSKIMIMLTFLVYILLPNSVVDPSTVFITLTLANYLRTTITNALPVAITGLYELRVSINRIQTFLLLEEKGDVTHSETSANKAGISIKDFTTRWTKEGQHVISNASVDIPAGQLTAVIGSVASGKSSLIHGILGEVPAETGSVTVDGTISYAPQDPWLFSGTIQENILAGEKLDLGWYAQVVEACSLTQDINMFPEGDQANVGEKGMVLSGGQKARVNLARAVYRKADIYLLDDPLSAVDVKVGKFLFEKCICGILKSKTVVLVTHHLKLLSTDESINVVLLKDNTVAASGPFVEVKQHLDFEVLSGFDVDHHDEEDKTSGDVPKPLVPSKTVKSKADNQKNNKKTDREETRTKGIVSWSLHHKYFSIGNGCFMLLLFVLGTIAAQVFTSGSDYWLKVWSGTETAQVLKNANGLANSTQKEAVPKATEDSDRYFYIAIYSAIIGGIFVTSALRNFTLVFWTMSSSKTLHNKLFMSLVRAPMGFFEKNSIGRVLNRIVNDIGNIDDQLPRIYQATVNNVFQIVGALLLVCFLQPLMVIPAFLLIILFHFLRNFFLSTASDVKRIESVARSPVFAHVGTTIAGLTVIRALQTQGFLRKQFIQKQDIHSSAFYLNFGTNRWFSLATDWLSTGYFLVLVVSYWLISAEDSSSLGLAISNALMLTLIFSFGVSQLTMLDNQLISVERVLEYIDIQSEGDLESPDTNELVWGHKGKIELSGATIAYGEKEVLRGLTLTINAGENIGIVGRTGAGKSTIINGLFRLVNLASGKIAIDDVDISTVGLHNLRRRLTIMPQNPQLFTGSVRYNLDPLNAKSDDEIYKALRAVKLLERLDNNLHSDVAPGGTNFSAGERQLLCLARAILSQTKILLLDEATASLDAETDRVIQNVISENFGDSTILTIAHRLDTIIKCDRVLVLDAGVAVEFDEPHVLLQSREGHFYDLVNQTKGSGSEFLHRMAEEAYNERRCTKL